MNLKQTKYFKSFFGQIVEKYNEQQKNHLIIMEIA